MTFKTCWVPSQAPNAPNSFTSPAPIPLAAYIASIGANPATAPINAADSPCPPDAIPPYNRAKTNAAAHSLFGIRMLRTSVNKAQPIRTAAPQ